MDDNNKIGYFELSTKDKEILNCLAKREKKRWQKMLIAIETDGHPFWNRNEYELLMVTARTFEVERLTYKVLKRDDGQQHTSHEFFFTDKGVEAQFFHCGSGYGKVPDGERFVAIPKSDYDKLVIIESEHRRECERNYEGNWKDNSDFEK